MPVLHLTRQKLARNVCGQVSCRRFAVWAVSARLEYFHSSARQLRCNSVEFSRLGALIRTSMNEQRRGVDFTKSATVKIILRTRTRARDVYPGFA